MNPIALQKLRDNPSASIATEWQGEKVTISFGIPHYRTSLQSHYKLNYPFAFLHFGLNITFQTHNELVLHDEDMALSNGMRRLLKEFGPIVIHNAYLPEDIASVGHRNRFPHLSFHRDRNESHATPYSMFYRNPFDEEQRFPRTSSTLFVSNEHARVELKKNGNGIDENQDLSHCMLFTEIENVDLLKDYLGKLVLEQPWNLAVDTGEICIQDNRQLLHASYYRNVKQDGYRIGVRYLA